MNCDRLGTLKRTEQLNRKKKPAIVRVFHI
nr:MAG TPA: hypothetical protein [Caudoviricetes sp.]DAO38876.1 MAG TPA: hypothetical protein [Caudoviricetes sp.]DAT26456.1 MAG TPA: hypothetical protein [Caudoviricetes sp.]